MKLLRLSLCISCMLFLFSCANEPVKPNIIIIFNDDQGYQDLGCYGSPDIKTPRVDQMAKEGMLFTDFYVASAVCSASRAALLTGCYPQKVGVRGVFWPNRDNGLNPENVTMAEILKQSGYATAAVGKWHLGDEIRYLPTSQGFDSYYGIPYSNDMYPSKNMYYADDCVYREGFSPDSLYALFADLEGNQQPRSAKNSVPLMRDTVCIEFPCDQATITQRYTDESLKFITANAEMKKPFFLYLANTMPHVPLYASDKFRGKSDRGLYGDVIEEIDYNTGRILDQLKDLGIEENTIVIFSSDNGPWLGKGKDGGCALPLFEGKFTSFEGGMRVPFIVKWPKEIPAGSVCNEIGASIDLLPTLASAAGAVLPEKPLDGKNIMDLWTGKEGAVTPHDYYYFVNQGQAVRSGDWKYHKKEFYSYKKTARDEEGPALYNLKEDIGERKNVIDENPELAKRLDDKLRDHLNDIN